MGLLIIAIVFFVLGILLAIMTDSEMGAGFLVGIGGVMLVILAILFIVAQANRFFLPAKYAVDKAYTSSVATNPQLTDRERTTAVKLIQDDNYLIANARALRGNFWVGIYYSWEVGDLEPLAFTGIPPAKNQMGIGITQDGK